MTYPNLAHLKYFIDSVELGSISAAAQKNLVSHPAVSRAITSLEKHLGIELLVHQKKLFQVTAEGRRVAEQAKVLLANASSFNSLSLEPSVGPESILTIAISRSLTLPYLQPILTSISGRHEKTKVRVQFGTTNEIIDRVAAQSVDLGITIGNLPMPTLKQVQIRAGNFVLIESTNRNGKERTRLDKRDFILTEARYETELLKREFYKHFKASLKVCLEVSSWEVLSRLVEEDGGIGLVPDILVTRQQSRRLRIVKLKWFDCGYGIYTHHVRRQSPQPALTTALETCSNLTW